MNELENEFFLNMVIRKSEDDKTDENGNFIFEVEASNENLDLQGQVVLQRALLGSKDHFLSDGVISYDHLHKRRGLDGQTISDPAMVIGEPMEVRTDGKKTIVVGKLYKSNEIAQNLIQKLKDGSTRIKASVGGIFPKIIKDAKTGVEKITSVLWNDLALTFAPVNATVSAANFARSMNPDEFVKALNAGTGTDSAEYTGGRALIPEDMEHGTVNLMESANSEYVDQIRSLIAALHTGEIKGQAEAIKFLEKLGMNSIQARAAVREINNFREGKL
ncbi:MAG: hypothetical protein LBH43_15400 [Treponema sp.]|nr:hypothetical protein [Treponema sp.]